VFVLSAEKLVADVRAALATLVGTGGASASPTSLAAWANLARSARGIGLAELGRKIDAVCSELDARGALAFEASTGLAHAVLAVHDQIEALSSALLGWSVEEGFRQGEPS
jgi:hypothetical protein